MVSFPPFRLDVAEERLWKGPKLLSVRRKPFAILRYLVANPRRLVTHEELLKEVWGGTVVSESSVRTHLHELRQILGDGIIETVIGRGYRFACEVAQDTEAPAPSVAPPAIPERAIVGRTAELAILNTALERARTGHRQLCFVTGEPGIGKTTLVDAFVDGLGGSDVIAIRGQNVEQHSTPEAYRPVIEMLGQLRYGKHGEQALASLVRFAPTFLAQVPHLVPDAQLAEVNRRAAGGTEAKMVRELIEALEAVCMHQPLVMVLEDLQWSDVATIDLLSLLGQRRERAHLLVIATSRHAEAQTVSHPLNRVMRTLVSRSSATALPLDRLDLAGVERLVASRFPAHELPREFVDVIANITAGTPLFLTAILDDLIARGMLEQQDDRWRLTVPIDEVAAHRPDSVKQLIDIQLDRLAAQEQRVLEAASLVGQVFSTALVAAALELTEEEVDDICDALARRGLFLRHEGTEDWPEGSQQSRYGVTHGLVQEVCGERSAPARRQRWHRAIAERLERGYGDAAADVAARLSTHYELGRSVSSAIRFRVLAAQRTAQRFAYVDAQACYRQALEMVLTTPETRERDELELAILGGIATTVLRKASDDRESIAQFERMIVLARRLGETAKLAASMVSLSVRYATLAQYQQATAITDDLVKLIEPLGDPALMGAAQATNALGLFWQGQIAEAVALIEPLTRPEYAPEEDTRIGILDPVARKTVLTSYLGASYLVLGRVREGLTQLERSREMAVSRRDPYTFGQTAANLARFHFLCGGPIVEIQRLAEIVLANSDADVWHPQAQLLLDWVRSTEAPLDGATLDGMVQRFRVRTSEFPMGASYLALSVIDALRRSDRAELASALTEQMIATTRACGELIFEPEILRIRGDLAAPKNPEAAVVAYHEAIASAERIGSGWFRFRATLSLAMLQPGAHRAALETTLAGVIGGDDAPHVIAANQLLR